MRTLGVPSVQSPAISLRQVSASCALSDTGAWEASKLGCVSHRNHIQVTLEGNPPPPSDAEPQLQRGDSAAQTEATDS